MTTYEIQTLHNGEWTNAAYLLGGGIDQAANSWDIEAEAVAAMNELLQIWPDPDRLRVVAVDADDVPTVEELLDQTAIGCDMHRWAVEGGSIEISTSELRPVLEQAYDPNMLGWPALISYDDENEEFHVA